MQPDEQILDTFMQHLDQVITVYLAHPHADEIPPQVPHEPIQWLIEHFEGTEGVTMVNILTGLVIRGATPGMCGRYVLTGDVELPFQGCEQAMFNSLIAALTGRVRKLPRVVQVIELIALIITNMAKFTGWHPESVFNRIGAGEADA